MTLQHDDSGAVTTCWQLAAAAILAHRGARVLARVPAQCQVCHEVDEQGEADQVAHARPDPQPLSEEAKGVQALLAKGQVVRVAGCRLLRWQQ